jgi:Pentapeptide repeats (8 copies)
LEAADLEGAILDNAVLVGANLNLASLKDVKLRGAQLGTQPGSGAPVTQLGGVFMVNVDLTDADLRGVNLTGAHLYGNSLLIRTKLDSADLSAAICAGAAFSGTLTDTVFNQAVLVNATFNGAVLSDAKFDSAYLQGADFSTASDVTGATLRNAAVATMPGEWMFMEQDGTPFTFPYGATMLGALAADPSVICPNDESGPCTIDKLTPVGTGPFPPQPACVPSEQFCFENCLSPPNFSDKPPCQ